MERLRMSQSAGTKRFTSNGALIMAMDHCVLCFTPFLTWDLKCETCRGYSGARQPSHPAAVFAVTTKFSITRLIARAALFCSPGAITFGCNQAGASRAVPATCQMHKLLIWHVVHVLIRAHGPCIHPRTWWWHSWHVAERAQSSLRSSFLMAAVAQEQRIDPAATDLLLATSSPTLAAHCTHC